MYLKYPRTHHLEDSAFQNGDQNMQAVRWRDVLKNKWIIVEEKLDGANVAISFSDKGALLLQSRGHCLRGGSREKQFDQFKTWAQIYKNSLLSILGNRYIMFGEWVYAKHTVFYDCLPHYFFEFDIFDKKNNIWFSTNERQKLLLGSPVISVPILYQGKAIPMPELKILIKDSLYKTSNWKKKIIPHPKVWKETDKSNKMEGIYIKVEEDKMTVDRCKYVRSTFISSVLESETHWASRPIFPNQLAEGVNIYGG